MLQRAKPPGLSAPQIRGPAAPPPQALVQETCEEPKASASRPQKRNSEEGTPKCARRFDRFLSSASFGGLLLAKMISTFVPSQLPMLCSGKCGKKPREADRGETGGAIKEREEKRKGREESRRFRSGTVAAAVWGV